MFANPTLFAGSMPIFLLATLALTLSPSVSSAHDPLRCEVKKASEKLRDFFAGRRINEVAVGNVSNGDQATPSSSGPGIKQLLIEELERAELKVKMRTEVALSITYYGRKVRVKAGSKDEQLVVEMRFTVTYTSKNEQEDIWTQRITNDEANRHILGLSVNHDNLMSIATSRQQTLLAFTKPRARFDGAVILAGENAPYGVEILVDEKPLTPMDENGFGQVKLQRHQTYAVRLINRSPIEAAARLSVDGLNVFTFSELRYKDGPYKGAPLYDMIVIPPKQSVTIAGWHRNHEIWHKFKITEYADTAAAKLNTSADIGTITATFCAVWEKTPPADEPPGSRSGSDDGTGSGEPTSAKYVRVQRTIGAVRGSVAVRYKVPPPAK